MSFWHSLQLRHKTCTKIVEIPLGLFNEIKAYCKENGIKDYRQFSIRCLEQGFAIVRYGVSPVDNVSRDEKGVKDNKSEKAAEAPVKSNAEEKPVEVVKPKRGLRIIKKD